jgi:hypothetical protein
MLEMLEDADRGQRKRTNRYVCGLERSFRHVILEKIGFKEKHGSYIVHNLPSPNSLSCSVCEIQLHFAWVPYVCIYLPLVFCTHISEAYTYIFVYLHMPTYATYVIKTRKGDENSIATGEVRARF